MERARPSGCIAGVAHQNPQPHVHSRVGEIELLVARGSYEDGGGEQGRPVSLEGRQ